MENATAYVEHSGCVGDMEEFARRLRDNLLVKHAVIGYIGVVVGTHAEPGAFGPFFLGRFR